MHGLLQQSYFLHAISRVGRRALGFNRADFNSTVVLQPRAKKKSTMICGLKYRAKSIAPEDILEQKKFV